MTLKVQVWRAEQEAHCCSDIPGTTVVTREDGGGGDFAVLTVEEFAFDSLQEFDQWAAGVREAVGACCGTSGNPEPKDLKAVDSALAKAVQP